MEQLLQRILTELQDIKAGQIRLEARMDRLEERMDRIETRMDRIEERMDRLEENQTQMGIRLDQIEERQSQLAEAQTRFDNQLDMLAVGQKRLDQKVDGIYQAVVRIEEGQPLDIFAMLEGIERKIDGKDSEIAVLNKRVFKLESDMERLNRQ